MKAIIQLIVGLLLSFTLIGVLATRSCYLERDMKLLESRAAGLEADYKSLSTLHSACTQQLQYANDELADKNLQLEIKDAQIAELTGRLTQVQQQQLASQVEDKTSGIAKASPRSASNHSQNRTALQRLQMTGLIVTLALVFLALLLGHVVDQMRR